MLPCSEACERNKEPILAVLREAFAGCTHVLEIGSGTGQHAVHFALAMKWLVWQPTETAEGMPGLRKRIFNEGPSNLRAPVQLDVSETPWDVRRVDGVFTANTLHIMHWPQVEAFFAGLPSVMKPETVLAIYGPFRYGGECTSDSNAEFDAFLRARLGLGPHRAHGRCDGGYDRRRRRDPDHHVATGPPGDEPWMTDSSEPRWRTFPTRSGCGCAATWTVGRTAPSGPRTGRWSPRVPSA
jgi:SAM-dependent methyltransferase